MREKLVSSFLLIITAISLETAYYFYMQDRELKMALNGHVHLKVDCEMALGSCYDLESECRHKLNLCYERNANAWKKGNCP